MNNLFILKQFTFAKLFAAVTIVSLVLSAFPASFLSANIAHALVTSSDLGLAVYANPVGTDSDLEYVTVTNNGPDDILMNNWILDEGGVEIALSGIFPVGAEVKICANDDFATNGGMICAWEFPAGFGLTNTGGTVKLFDPADNEFLVATWDDVSGSESNTPAVLVNAVYPPAPPACTPQFDSAEATTNIQNTTTGDYFDSIADAIADCDTEISHTIALLGDITVTDETILSKAITLEGNGNTIIADFAKDVTPGANSVLEVASAGDIAITNLTIDGALSTDLHGINLFNADEMFIGGVTINDMDRSGIVVNGSEVLVNEYTTSGNGWNAINVDITESAITAGASESTLEIEKTSMHAETTSFGQEAFLAHIYIDDTSKPVTVADIDDQYDFTDFPIVAAASETENVEARVGGEVPAARAYVLKEPEPELPVTPIFECYVDNGDDTGTGYFGYLNENDMSVDIALGTGNFVTGGPNGGDEGQPTTFAAGRTDFVDNAGVFEPGNAAFSVDFPLSGNAVWTLTDPAGDTRTATAGTNGALCPLPPEPVEELTVVASKIVCDYEAQLPNWGAGAGPITETTAADWVAENDGCELESGWEFEWAPFGTSNPGDDLYGTAGGDWNTFGPTDLTGTASVTIPLEELGDNSKFWMREVLQDGFIPFTHEDDRGNDFSAEFYCHTDAKNYDNYDRIDNFEADGEYHCVAWNASIEPPIEYAPYCGDGIVNQEWEMCDGDVVNEDLEILRGCFFSPAEDECEDADFNDDGIINMLDLAEFKTAEDKDFSGNGFVDLRDLETNEDLNYLKGCFFGPGEGECEDADLNDDGNVNFIDLGLFKTALEYDLSGDGQVDLRDDTLQCTDSCQLDNQCSMHQLVKITLDENAPQSVSFDGTLHLGEAGNQIPNGTWFNFDEAGDDAVNTIANGDIEGLAIERTETELRLALKGENSRTGFDYAFGTIMTKGIELGSVDRGTVTGWELENSGEYVDVFDKNPDESIDFKFWATTGDDAVAVEIEQGEIYNCELCYATVEARVVVDGYGYSGEGDLSDEIILGDASYSTVAFGEWFPISLAPNPGESAVMINDPNTVTNFANAGDKPGLFVSREDGTVKVALYGEYNPGGNTNNEWIEARIEVRDAEIENYEELSGGYKFENHNNPGVPSNDGFDEASADDTGVDFKLWVDTGSDGFKFDIAEIEFCEDDSKDDMVIDGYKFEEGYDTVEPVEGWEITLYTENGDFVATTSTDVDGYYQFTVPQGDYHVYEEMRLGWYQVAVFQNGEPVREDEGPLYCEFDYNPRDHGDDRPLRLSGGDEPNARSYYHCEFYNEQEETYRIDGYKYEGEYEGDSVPVPGWLIYLYNDETGNLEASTSTDEFGYYYFEVPGGEWEVREAEVLGWEQIGVLQNDDYDYVDGEYESCFFYVREYEQDFFNVSQALTTDSDEDIWGYGYRCDFYNEQMQDELYVIDGYKFEGTTEVGLANWTIELRDAEGDLITSTTTNESGYYRFEVPAGAYEVHEVVPSDWFQVDVSVSSGLTTTDLDVNHCILFVGNELQVRDVLSVSEVLLAQSDYGCDFYNEQEEVITTNGGGGGSSSGTRTRPEPTPLVLGEATVNQCPFLIDFMQVGWENDMTQVTKLQLFLNIFKDMFGGTETPVTGVFDQTTDANVKAFQEQFRSEILDPWFERGIVPHSRPTGFVYKTTLWKINDLVCPDYAILPSFEGEDLTQNVNLD